MLNTRRFPGPQAMAWRTAEQAETRPLNISEAVRCAAMLLPLVCAGLLVVALRRGVGLTSPLVPLIGALVAAEAAVIAVVDRARSDSARWTVVRIATRAGWPVACAAPFGVAAAALTAAGRDPLFAAALWGCGIAILLLYAVALERPRLSPPTPIDAIALSGLLALTALLRIPHLIDLPAFVHSDEAQMGLHTRIALHGGMPSLFGTTDWWSVPWLGPALEAPVMLFGGEGLLALRLGSVLAALVAVAGLWFLGSELWSRRAGFVAALLFAFLAPSIHFGRDGAHYMQSVAALVWTVLCYTRATRRYSGMYAAITGVLMAIDVQLYYAARLAVPLIFAHALCCGILERGLLRNWLRLIAWTAIGMAVAFLPFGAYYLKHPAAIGQRTDAVFIFSQARSAALSRLADYPHSSWLDIVGRQVHRVLLGFFALGDRSEQFGAQTPLLDPLTASMLPAACGLALARARQAPWLLCLLWAGITLIFGGVLTTGQPDAPRLLPAIAVACLLIGGFVHALLQAAGETGLRDARPLIALATAGALIVAANINADAYLRQYPATAATQPVTLTTDIGRFLHGARPDVPVVLYDQRQFYLLHWTIQLLAPQVHGSTVWTPDDLTAQLAAIHGSFLVVAVDPQSGLLENLAARYRGATITMLSVHDPSHRVLAFAYGGSGLT